MAEFKSDKKLSLNSIESFFESEESCQIPNLSFLYEQIFGRKIDGTLLEVGAYDGESFSNSTGLIKSGWRAHLIEPMPYFAQLCQEKYANNFNVTVHN